MANRYSFYSNCINKALYRKQEMKIYKGLLK